MTKEQLTALDEQLSIQKDRLKRAPEHQKEGIMQLIDDLEKKLGEDAEPSQIEQIEASIKDFEKRLAKIKENPSSIPVASHPQTGKVLKTKGEVDIEGLQAAIGDHKKTIERLKGGEERGK